MLVYAIDKQSHRRSSVAVFVGVRGWKEYIQRENGLKLEATLTGIRLIVFYDED